MKKAILLTGLIGVIGVFTFFYYGKNTTEIINPETYKIELSDYKNGEDIFITPQTLKEKLGTKDLVILDGNHPKNFAKGHIPGAINIGFKGLCRSAGKPGDPEWGTILPKKELTEKLQSFGITNKTLVVAYSDTFKGPGAGGRAVWQLRMAGLENVKLLYGGQQLWKTLGYELTKEASIPTTTTGLVLNDYDESFRATRTSLEQNLGKIALIDVRSKKEFTGDDTSRGEARGGHITDAVWIEWTDFLNKDATPKTPDEITTLLAGYGVKPEDDFVLY